MQIQLTLDPKDQSQMQAVAQLFENFANQAMNSTTVDEIAEAVAKEPVAKNKIPQIPKEPVTETKPQPTKEKESPNQKLVRALMAKAKRKFSAAEVSEILTTAKIPTKIEEMTEKNLQQACVLLDDMLNAPDPEKREEVKEEETDDVPF